MQKYLVLIYFISGIIRYGHFMIITYHFDLRVFLKLTKFDIMMTHYSHMNSILCNDLRSFFSYKMAQIRILTVHKVYFLAPTIKAITENSNCL